MVKVLQESETSCWLGIGLMVRLEESTLSQFIVLVILVA